jgi:hypothetical protein
MEGVTLHDFAADIAGVIEGLDVAPAFVLGTPTGTGSLELLRLTVPISCAA